MLVTPFCSAFSRSCTAGQNLYLIHRNVVGIIVVVVVVVVVGAVGIAVVVGVGAVVVAVVPLAALTGLSFPFLVAALVVRFLVAALVVRVAAPVVRLIAILIC